MTILVVELICFSTRESEKEDVSFVPVALNYLKAISTLMGTASPVIGEPVSFLRHVLCLRVFSCAARLTLSNFSSSWIIADGFPR
jgi:hypothetical protein